MKNQNVVFGIVWAGSVMVGAGIGMLMDNLEAGGAIGVGMGLILTALVTSGVYRRDS